ncbi:MAG: Permease of the drug/metabolite transporter superfamily [Devosia sp.]|uniref:DMT family transporter n=1 Tax=Devosia sp. TaxID=1871048 RepID=UPI0026073E70|nr:DMT family transporter [Devosia sp.]MDB5540055.1 Permease of the drug/metabolite transporter superfamily [Devosia sp.]
MASAVKPIEDRRLLGISLMLVGYLCYTIIDSCAKLLTQAGLPTMEVVFVRYAGQLTLVLAIFLPREGARALTATRSLPLEIVRGLCLLGSTVFNFVALTFLPLTVTSAISFTMPLILCSLSIPMLGETVGWRRWAAIAVGFIGVLVIVQPGTEAFHPAVILSLITAVFSALYNLLTRKLAGVDTTTTQQFYAAAAATVCIAPFSLGGWTWPHELVGWLAFFGIGLAALIGHLSITTAHRYAPASVLAPFGYLQIIFMTASSWLVFNQPPDMWIFIGAPIVIASGLYIWLRERQLSKSVVTEMAVQD